MKPYVAVGLAGVVLDAVGNAIWVSGMEREAGLHPLVLPVLFAIDALLALMVLVAGRLPGAAPWILGLIALLFAPLALLGLFAGSNLFDAPTFVVSLVAWLLAVIGSRPARLGQSTGH